MKRIKAVLTIIFTLSILTGYIPTKLNAAPDFEYTTNYTIDYKEGEDFVTVTEELQVNVYNTKYYYPSGGDHTFSLPSFSLNPEETEGSFKKDSIIVKGQYGTDKEYTLVGNDNAITVTVPITSRIDSSNAYTVSVSYKTHELVSINGAITNLYIPGLHEDTTFSEDKNELSTTYTYNTTLTTPKDSLLPSYIQPNSITSSTLGNKTTYSISQQDRLDTTAWLQLGSNQYYYFKMVQPSPQTDFFTPEGISDISELASTNVYKLALPREFDETQQKVFFTQLTPEPTQIERDAEGNIIATFEVPANKETEIVVEGYISLYKKPIDQTDNNIPNLNLTEYKKQISALPDMQIYLQPDTYWEIEDPLIQNIANDLLKRASSIQELIEIDYQYVIGEFDYSYEKANSSNPRLGAKASLSGGQSICMEYADSLTAILRAQGIPARAALGYGNDPTGAENKISNTEILEQKIGHQWVQIWIPDYGWLSVDPTWGETGRRYIGSDLDHILWYTVGDEDELIADTLVYSADNLDQQNISNFKLFLKSIDTDPTEGVQDLSEILESHQGEDNGIQEYIMTTPLGRGIVLITPLLAAVVISLIFVFTVKLLTSLSRKKPTGEL